MATRRALVIGGSLGGLFAANLLRSVGWDVTVFERNAEDLTGRGAGISTHPQLIDVTRRARHRLRRVDGHQGRHRHLPRPRAAATYLETPTVRAP